MEIRDRQSRLLLAVADEERRSLAGLNLRNAVLSGVELEGVILEDSDLTGADLSGAEATGGS